MEHNFERLKAHILQFSNSQDFFAAQNEWKLVGIEIQEDGIVALRSSNQRALLYQKPVKW